MDALVSLHKVTLIYTGFLVDCELSKSGGLQTIYLSNAERYALAVADEETKNVSLDSHLLVLRDSEISNISLTYFGLEGASGRKQVVRLGSGEQNKYTEE